MQTVTIENRIAKNIDQVWEMWTNPKHITGWNFASPEWHCPQAEHKLEIGCQLKYHMAAIDGSMSFDYVGTFTSITPNELLEYTLDDGRKVSIHFSEEGGVTKVVESFEVEDENTIEMQRQGWQAILNNFKKYVESK